jgi:hypothetical protein
LQSVDAMRFLWILALAPACTAGRYRTEMVGHGGAVVVTRGAAVPDEPVAAPGSGIALEKGSYQFALRFSVPRAQLVEWKVRCAGGEMGGTVGETFADYRERRLAEMRRTAPPRAAVVVAQPAPLPPPVYVRGRLRLPSPLGPVQVGGAVRVAPSAPPPPSSAPVEPAATPEPEPQPEPELAAGDVGANVYGTGAHLEVTAAGPCTVTAIADDANVDASFSVTRIRDLDAEERLRRMAVTGGAVKVRGRLAAQLVAYGAEAGRVARVRAEAEAAREAARVAVQVRLDGEAEARMRVEAERRERIRIERETRLRVERERVARIRHEEEVRVTYLVSHALDYRRTYVAYLVGKCGADPMVRRRERARIEEERLVQLRIRQQRDAEIALRLEQERAAKLRIRQQHEAELAVKLEAERARAEREAAALAELERQRGAEALRVRARIAGLLIGYGAVKRPPMPALLDENPGAAPFEGARWIAGHWVWESAKWSWIRGGWRDDTVFGVAGGPSNTDVVVDVAPPAAPVVVGAPPVIIGVPPPVVVVPGVRVGPRPPVVDHRRPPPVRRDDKRDHRKKHPDDRR